MTLTRLLVFGFAMCVSACATWGGGRTAPWPWAEETLCRTTTCDEYDVTKAFEAANRYCAQVQNYYERGGRVADGTRLAVGLGGTLLGALGPAASTTGAQVMSSLSGSANAVQVAMDESLNSAMMTPRRMAVLTAARVGAERILASKASADERVRLAVNMARECSGAAAQADSQAAEAIAAVTPKVVDSVSKAPKVAAAAAADAASAPSGPTAR
jgi:hypothetical protein